jgi:hypothetical protein
MKLSNTTQEGHRRRTGRRWRNRFAGALAAAAALCATALTVPAGAAVNGGHVIATLYKNSGLELSGYTPGATLTVEIMRSGVRVGTMTDLVDDAGNLNVNPTACWTDTTPEILPGDVVSVTGDGAVDTKVVQDVSSTVTRRDPQNSGTILVTGTALDPVTALPLPLAAVEVRIVGKSAFSNGKKVLRTTVTPGVTLGSFEARFAGFNSSDQKLMLAPLETRAVARNAALNEVTISQNPAAPGPAAPCTAPLARNAITGANRTSVNVANVGSDLVLNGISSGATAVSVSLDDQNPATAAVTATATPAPALGSQTWSVTIPAASVAGLTDGTLTAAATYTVAGTTVGGTNLTLPKDTIAPPAPSATPGTGLYNSAQSVTLSDADATATVRYSSAGPDPAIASPSVTGPISVTSTQLLKAIAIDQVGNASPIAAFAYTIDTAAPVTALSGGPSAVTSMTSASFGFSSADATATFQCKLDADPWSACSSPQSFTALADASHTFAVRAVDSAGNVEPTPPSRTWTVDTVAPVTSITAGPTGTTTATNASLEFASSEPGSSFECSLDGGAWSACITPDALSALSNGSHTFDVRARDAAGNVDPTPKSRSWNVDNTAPETTITAGPSGTTGPDATFEFAASEPGSTFECRVGGGPWNGCSSPAQYSGFGPGPHTFDVRATDAVGNVDATPASRTWSVDSSVSANGAPVGLQINGGAQFTNSPNVTVSALPRLGQVSGVRLSNDGGFLNAAAFPLTATGQYSWTLDSGGAERLPKTVYVRFVGAGMDQGETFTDDIILDQTNPQVVQATIGGNVGQVAAVGQVGAAARPARVLRLVASDQSSGVGDVQVTAKIGRPGAWLPYAARISTRIRGTGLYVRVRDRAGNLSSWRKVSAPRASRGVSVHRRR